MINKYGKSYYNRKDCMKQVVKEDERIVELKKEIKNELFKIATENGYYESDLDISNHANTISLIVKDPNPDDDRYASVKRKAVDLMDEYMGTECFICRCSYPYDGIEFAWVAYQDKDLDNIIEAMK